MMWIYLKLVTLAYVSHKTTIFFLTWFPSQIYKGLFRTHFRCLYFAFFVLVSCVVLFQVCIFRYDTMNALGVRKLFKKKFCLRRKQLLHPVLFVSRKIQSLSKNNHEKERTLISNWNKFWNGLKTHTKLTELYFHDRLFRRWSIDWSALINLLVVSNKFLAAKH